jgi:hypothetical protein
LYGTGKGGSPLGMMIPNSGTCVTFLSIRYGTSTVNKKPAGPNLTTTTSKHKIRSGVLSHFPS